MAESKATAPDFALEARRGHDAVHRAARAAEGAAGAGAVPSYNDMVVKAAALALREHPKVNGAYRDGALRALPAR